MTNYVKHLNKVGFDERLTNSISIAYDESHYHGRMDASISVFMGSEEIFTETRAVHGKPASSTRAKIYGVFLCLDYIQKVQKIDHEVQSVFLYGNNTKSLRNINEEDEL